MIATQEILTLGKFSSTYKVLFTGFLMAVGCGLLMAGAQIRW